MPPPQPLPVPSFDTSLTPREQQEKEKWMRNEEKAGGGVRRGPDELKPDVGDLDIASANHETTASVDMSEDRMHNTTGRKGGRAGESSVDFSPKEG